MPPRPATTRCSPTSPASAGPSTLPGNEHVWHLYVMRVADRDEVLGRLHAEGIGAGIHYPVPVHLTPALAGLGQGPGSCPVAERAAGEILSLPMFPGITPAQQERVVDVLAALPDGRVTGGAGTS